MLRFSPPWINLSFLSYLVFPFCGKWRVDSFEIVDSNWRLISFCNQLVSWKIVDSLRKLIFAVCFKIQDHFIRDLLLFASFCGQITFLENWFKLEINFWNVFPIVIRSLFVEEVLYTITMQQYVS